jgi:3-oxoadipate enol-lactonase
MPHIKANEVNLYYEMHGEGEPLVLIAGFSADSTAWSEVVDSFKQDFQVVVLDNRGVGQSEIPMGSYTIVEMAQDVISLCDKLHINKAHFIGNSMGGFIVQSLIHRFPDRVNTAIISNSTYTADCGFNLYLQAQLDFLKAGVPVDLLVRASCSWVYSYDFLVTRSQYEEVVQLALNNPFPFTLEGYEGQFSALKEFNSLPWLNTIKTPTLILGSDNDLIFPEPSIRALSEHIPDAKYHGFRNCGHLPMIEYPEEFTQVVKSFIKD